jgi:Ca2+-binding EF-hand superfamily protein
MTISSVSASSLLQQMQQALFSSLDKNADGVLSQSEFQSIGQNVPASANSAASSSSTSTSTTQATTLSLAQSSFSNDILQSLLSLQNQAAASGESDPLTSFDPASAASSLESSYGTDGSMSKSQFESAYQSLSGGDSSSGSGQVSHHHHHHHHEADAANSTQQADTDFTAADSNGDGQLSTSELTSYLTSSQQMAEQGVAQYQAASSLVNGLIGQLISSLNSSTSTTAAATASVTA